MERTLLAFVWRHSWQRQIGLLVLTFATFPFVYASLEIPKIIINQAINGTDFPRTVLGTELAQIPYLLLLCGVFLALVVVINALKWLLNVGIGMTGERVLRRLRYQLFEHVMRFPMQRLRGARTGETVQSILGEVEPLGGFIGEILATPVFQAGLLTVYVVFIFVQDVWLGLAAVALYPVQAVLVPMLQARIVRLNKERVANTRDLADRIGESLGTVAEIRTNDTARWHLAQVASRLGTNMGIRGEIFRRKFTIKFINNFMLQLTPFFFYAAGGYLVIVGRLDFGSLVAVLAAYKDLAGPWKALLGFVQRWSDFTSRYRFAIEGFLDDGLCAEDRLFRQDAPPLGPPLVLEGVRARPGSEGLSVPALTLGAGETLAITGGESGAREAALRLMAGIDDPEAGRIMLGGTNLAEATLAQIGAAIGYVGARPGMVKASLRENALYGLYRRLPEADGPIGADTRPRIQELFAAGQPTAEPPERWIAEPAGAGGDTRTLEQRLLQLTRLAGLDETLYALALDRHLPLDQAERWSAPLLTLRARVAEAGMDLADLAEPWAPGRFNRNAPLLDNLLFGLPVGPPGRPADYLAVPAVGTLLEKSGGHAVLEEIGWDIAGELALLGDTVKDLSPLLDRFAAFTRQDFADTAALIAEGGTRGPTALGRADRARLRALAARFVPVRDRLDVVDEDREARILEIRGRCLGPIRDSAAFIAFDDPRYNPMQTVADNILNARRRYDRRTEWHRLDALLETAIRESGLLGDLVGIGLDTPLAEANLSLSALRRLALVRAVIKRPQLLILDGIADSDSVEDRALRRAIRTELPEVALVHAAASEAAADGARIAAIDRSGRLEAP